MIFFNNKKTKKILEGLINIESAITRKTYKDFLSAKSFLIKYLSNTSFIVDSGYTSEEVVNILLGFNLTAIYKNDDHFVIRFTFLPFYTHLKILDILENTKRI